MQMKIFHIFMQRLVKVGTIHIIDHSGFKRSYRGTPSLPEVTIRLHNKHIIFRLLFNPDLAMGEGYMNNEITIESGSIYDLLSIITLNLDDKAFFITQKLHIWWQIKFKKLVERITPRAAKSNVAHHYNLSQQLYNLFLDDDWQYSCAYFHDLDNDLNRAQLDKKNIWRQSYA